MQYTPSAIEPKWQAYWNEHKSFAASNDAGDTRPTYYTLSMFPYPSGTGLHVGHPESYTAVDIVARYKRMNGFNVLNPFGFDAFGLPAERAAQRDGVHPAAITVERMEYFRKQVKALGFSFDWDREVVTCQEDYYRWTQQLFMVLYERGLAYLGEVPVWWSREQGTVLANEEVNDGRYIETGEVVEKRIMRQWMLKITEYAESLLDGLNELEGHWPQSLIDTQRAWIGKSEGANVTFGITDHDGLTFDVFTTRPDTLGAATFCVLAPELALVEDIVTQEQREAVEAYVAKAKNKSDLDRQIGEKTKTGVFTGAFAVNPLTGKEIPIWIADYVLASYGTGAVMAVPAHDERDHEFARTFNLPIVSAYKLPDGVDISEAAIIVADNEDYVTINLGDLDGLHVNDAKAGVVAKLEQQGAGHIETTYKLRDWLFSRQRYWGEPFPILHGPNGEIELCDRADLPIVLPHVDEYKPTADGEPPLARAGSDWLQVERNGEIWTRETNTMPQWAGSCWYFLRYMDPHNANEPFSREATEKWGDVDLYIGGVEHAVLHLLYARFWNHVFFDAGLVPTKEPFKRLFNQGMILANSYREESGKYHHPNDVVQKLDQPVTMKSPNNQEMVTTNWYTKDGSPVEEKSGKMGKSLNNSIDPMEIVADYGADALRTYEMFMGPLDQNKVWSTSGCDGVFRFLSRVWRVFIDPDTDQLVTFAPETDRPKAIEKALHAAIKEATTGIETLHLNTPIAKMMEFVNVATSSQISRSEAEDFVKILSPWAPHLAEELWSRLGHEGSLTHVAWPKWDEDKLIDDEITIVIQINGKLRGKFLISRDSDKDSVLAAAREEIGDLLTGQTIKKEIVVPGRLVNFVV